MHSGEASVRHGIKSYAFSRNFEFSNLTRSFLNFPEKTSLIFHSAFKRLELEHLCWLASCNILSKTLVSAVEKISKFRSPAVWKVLTFHIFPDICYPKKKPELIGFPSYPMQYVKKLSVRPNCNSYKNSSLISFPWILGIGKIFMFITEFGSIAS